MFILKFSGAYWNQTSIGHFLGPFTVKPGCQGDTEPKNLQVPYGQAGCLWLILYPGG